MTGHLLLVPRPRRPQDANILSDKNQILTNHETTKIESNLRIIALAFTCAALAVSSTFAQTKKPNILVIWGDDIGYRNTAPTTRA